MTSGVRALDLASRRRTGGGKARLTMTYTDGAGLDEDRPQDREDPQVRGLT